MNGCLMNDQPAVKVTHLKRRIERFYIDQDDGRTAFALFEDVDGNIHYRYTDFDTDQYQLPVMEFYQQFKQEGIQNEQRD